MKLYLNKTSPYARLTLATAHEAGLADQIDLAWIEPWDNPPALLAVNPLGKIPVLVTDDGTALMESSCICDFLASSSRKSTFKPLVSPPALRRLGLGRAAMDCAFSAVIQLRFNQGRQSPLSERWLAAVPRAAATLEMIFDTPNRQPDLGDLAVAVAFDYVDFRLPEVAWRNWFPRLAQGVDEILNRPSMLESSPKL